MIDSQPPKRSHPHHKASGDSATPALTSVFVFMVFEFLVCMYLYILKQFMSFCVPIEYLKHMHTLLNLSPRFTHSVQYDLYPFLCWDIGYYIRYIYIYLGFGVSYTHTVNCYAREEHQ